MRRRIGRCGAVIGVVIVAAMVMRAIDGIVAVMSAVTEVCRIAGIVAMASSGIEIAARCIVTTTVIAIAITVMVVRVRSAECVVAVISIAVAVMISAVE